VEQVQFTIRRPHEAPATQDKEMIALAEYYNSQRQTVTEMRQANKLGAQLARRFHQTGAIEILTKLRSVLEGIENCVSTEQALAPEFHSQLQDWEGLHHEARSTIAAMIESECEACRQ
jgi:hypothetical protein